MHQYISLIRSYLAYNTYKAIGKGLISSARISDDGRIIISLDLKKKLPDLPDGYANEVKEYAVDEKTYTQPPNLAIVIMIVGSRGTNPPEFTYPTSNA